MSFGIEIHFVHVAKISSSEKDCEYVGILPSKGNRNLTSVCCVCVCLCVCVCMCVCVCVCVCFSIIRIVTK